MFFDGAQLGAFSRVWQLCQTFFKNRSNSFGCSGGSRLLVGFECIVFFINSYPVPVVESEYIMVYQLRVLAMKYA